MSHTAGGDFHPALKTCMPYERCVASRGGYALRGVITYAARQSVAQGVRGLQGRPCGARGIAHRPQDAKRLLWPCLMRADGVGLVRRLRASGIPQTELKPNPDAGQPSLNQTLVPLTV